MVEATEKIPGKPVEDRAVCEEYNLKNTDYRRMLVPKKSVFDLRTEAMRTDGGKPKQGRLYDTRQAEKPGGIRVDEIIYGLKMAHVSCTDDSEERLVNSSANSLIALEKLVGGPEPEVTSRLPLSQILKECFDLNLDCWMDKSGFVKGRAIDTQGFIASNDDMIVLSYRFSTTLYDWIANLTFTSSEWKLDSDEDLGHAGVFSSCRGWFTKLVNRKKSRPRVHTAYYNNFIYTIPEIRKYIIEPLLKDYKAGEDFKPKKIYVCGCSLGAAVSQLAWCFILDELYEHMKDPEFKRVDRLISVTAGSPRVGDKKFRKYIQDKMDVLRPLDRAVICRLVYNIDIVPHAPPNILNFCHLSKLVYITKDGKNFIVNPKLSKKFSKWGELKTIYSTAMKEKAKAGTEDEEAKEGDDDKTPFEKECEAAAEVVLDHMPYWYMFYMDKLKAEQDALYAEKPTETIAEA